VTLIIQVRTLQALYSIYCLAHTVSSITSHGACRSPS
jgi:hypothetical protein